MKNAIANFVFVVLLALGAGSGAALADGSAAGAQTPIGVWLFPNNRFAVAIVSCGNLLCGKVSWLKAPMDDHGQPRVDNQNPDTSLRSRPILGLTVLTGLHRNADGDWEGGQIYNPDDGSYYAATLAVNDNGTLRVRAYVGVPMLGKTLTLTRVA